MLVALYVTPYAGVWACPRPPNNRVPLDIFHGAVENLPEKAKRRATDFAPPSLIDEEAEARGPAPFLPPAFNSSESVPVRACPLLLFLFFIFSIFFYYFFLFIFFCLQKMHALLCLIMTSKKDVNSARLVESTSAAPSALRKGLLLTFGLFRKVWVAVWAQTRANRPMFRQTESVISRQSNAASSACYRGLKFRTTQFPTSFSCFP